MKREFANNLTRIMKEKGVYEQLLEDPDTEVKGTVKERAEKYSLTILDMTGCLDGINAWI